MYRTVQLVVAGIAAVAFGLVALSRRYPEVAWLQPFRHALPQLSERQRATMRRRANVYAGAELILMGLALPMGYIALRARRDP